MKNKVFNRRMLLFLFGFLLFSSLAVHFLISNERDLGIAFSVVSLLVLLGLVLSPLYFVFTKKEIRVVWLLLPTKVISFAVIQTILEKKWGETVKDLPKYEVMYLAKYKGKSIVRQFDIPRNKKTKQMLEQYAKNKMK